MGLNSRAWRADDRGWSAEGVSNTTAARRLNVSVPADLVAAVRAAHPDLNVSRVLQLALVELLGCQHSRVVCTSCSADVDVDQVVADRIGRFYLDALAALEPLISGGGTVEGAARVMKGVALDYRLPAASTPLPRPTRAEREDLAWRSAQEAV